jgi:plasmid stability protein
VATLNIKNLPDSLHQKLKERAKRERRSVAQQVIEMLSRALEEPPTEAPAAGAFAKPDLDLALL